MSPFTRFVRTFASAEIAVVAVAVTAVQTSHNTTDLKLLVLGTIAALITAVAAYALAAADVVATTPLGKAFAQTLQVFGGGLATIGLVSLSSQDIAAFGTAVGWLAVAALGSGLLSLLTLASGSSQSVTSG